MRTVHKFELTIGTTTLYLPPDARCLHVGNQYENLCLWVELDPHCAEANKRPFDFRVFGTGHQIDDFAGLDVAYIGTALLQGGSFVAHVYRGKPA